METKICSRCKRKLPATLEYFFKCSKVRAGLRSTCKECFGYKFTAHKARPRDGYKFCFKCKRELPATLEYFFGRRDRKDGLESSCKECRGRSFGLLKPQRKAQREGFMVCGSCAQELPATTEYFFVAQKGKHGFHSICKKCQREQFLEYKKNNPEKYKAKEARNARNYWLRNKDEITAKNKAWREKNKDWIKEYGKRYRKENKEILARRKKNYSDRNRDKCNTWSQKYKTRKQDLPASLTVEQWQKCVEHFNDSCAYCGKPHKRLAQEHFIPLSKGGEYAKDNIVPACRSCNSSKNNKDPLEWFRAQPFYSKMREAKILKYLGYKDNVQQLSIL